VFQSSQPRVVSPEEFGQKNSARRIQADELAVESELREFGQAETILEQSERGKNFEWNIL